MIEQMDVWMLWHDSNHMPLERRAALNSKALPLTQPTVYDFALLESDFVTPACGLRQEKEARSRSAANVIMVVCNLAYRSPVLVGLEMSSKGVRVTALAAVTSELQPYLVCLLPLKKKGDSNVDPSSTQPCIVEKAVFYRSINNRSMTQLRRTADDGCLTCKFVHADPSVNMGSTNISKPWPNIHSCGLLAPLCPLTRLPGAGLTKLTASAAFCLFMTRGARRRVTSYPGHV
ncbi:hypothetical protein EGR_09843 [Echinococcus granulosus]|uniref:Uncharacterized protein n=1 Tax=Echinococcus granulosus TaxID=6210 RepID=W6U3Z4_ECHGR|nr:hypothetical protein EGR_09841 [Echinococcus granulosus]XP_024346512.1 hypothetical protein EGR_09843 [Echinococcus granulosus]EUB55314.1 hypothetical protein EGR_09841 [Echinococcus granulosus]EUB55316.1 hypothetical protein EGR_09843 [Echinococcus granulosus]